MASRSQAAAASIIDPEPGPENICRETTSGGSVPKPIADHLSRTGRAVWRFNTGLPFTMDSTEQTKAVFFAVCRERLLRRIGAEADDGRGTVSDGPRRGASTGRDWQVQAGVHRSECRPEETPTRRTKRKTATSRIAVTSGSTSTADHASSTCCGTVCFSLVERPGRSCVKKLGPHDLRREAGLGICWTGMRADIRGVLRPGCGLWQRSGGERGS